MADARDFLPPFYTSKYGSLPFTLYNTFTLGRDDHGHDMKLFGATSGKYLLWDESADTLQVVGTLAFSGAQQIVGSLDMDGSIDADYTGVATRPYDFQTVVTATMTTAVDKQFLYVRSDLDGGWNEDVSGGDGYTVGMFRGYIGASAGGVIAEGLRAGMNLDAGVIVSDGAGAGYIAGARFTTYVPATANAKTNKGVIIAPRDDTAVAAIAGSQYIGAQIYLKQAVAKAESWGLDIYTESGCATLNAAINIRNGGVEVYTYGIDLNSANIGTADLRLSGGGTIGDATILLPVRAATAYAYGVSVEGEEVFFVGGAATKSYLLYVAGDRPAGSAATGDSNDAQIRVSGNNYAANDANFIWRGINASINNRDGGTLGRMDHNFGVQNKSGGTCPTLIGLTVTAENYGTCATEFGGLDVVLKNEGAAATLEYGVRARNLNNSVAGAVNAAFLATDTGTNTGWNYGLDLYGATIQRAAFRDAAEVCFLSGTGAPTDGTSGTGATFGAIGSLYADYTNGNLYLNAGTKASPTWKLVTRAG
jgi:hypothetical protein